MKRDPIVEEVRKAREAYASKFNYDLDAIFEDLVEKQKRSKNLVSFENKRSKQSPKNVDL